MQAVIKREIVLNKALCRTFGVFIFVILTASSAFVRLPLPFTPVPVTLQTLFVLLSAAILGKNLGILAQLSYVFLGVVGMPIFSAAGSGFMYLAGPTGGYLFGFILASFFVGKFIQYAGNKPVLIFAIFCIADVIILSSGVLWLKFLTGLALIKLLYIGFIPFIAVDLLKVGLATSLYLLLKSRAREIF